MTDWVHLKNCALDHDVPGICRGKVGGRPIIIQPEDPKRSLQYGRASGAGDALDDKNGLIPWSQANAVRGVLADERLATRFRQVDDGWVTEDAKKATKGVLKDAAVRGGAEVKADRGTMLHRWTEMLDRGEDPGLIPPEFQTDLMAYEYATEGLEHLVIEEFCVLDPLKLAGTPDRISHVPFPDPDGEVGNKIVDVKTGRISFAQKMTAQLAVYSRAVRYHQYPDGTCARSPFPAVSQRWGVIIHLPAGAGEASLHWIDLTAGWTALTEYVPTIKGWRSRKDLLIPVHA